LCRTGWRGTGSSNRVMHRSKEGFSLRAGCSSGQRRERLDRWRVWGTGGDPEDRARRIPSQNLIQGSVSDRNGQRGRKVVRKPVRVKMRRRKCKKKAYAKSGCRIWRNVNKGQGAWCKSRNSGGFRCRALSSTHLPRDPDSWDERSRWLGPALLLALKDRGN
jgi:hypothetical protein